MGQPVSILGKIVYWFGGLVAAAGAILGIVLVFSADIDGDFALIVIALCAAPGLGIMAVSKGGDGASAPSSPSPRPKKRDRPEGPGGWKCKACDHWNGQESHFCVACATAR